MTVTIDDRYQMSYSIENILRPVVSVVRNRVLDVTLLFRLVITVV